MLRIMDTPTLISNARREQLLRDGYVLFPSALPPDLLERLRRTTARQLDAMSEEDRRTQRTTGSMLLTNTHPIYAELIAHSAALEALAALGYAHPSFSDGYIISKPGHSPRLFWHYDWFAWQDARSYEMEPMQLFAMIYLSDTRRENGCLRVIPGSHIRHNVLHDLLAPPHSLGAASDFSLPDFSDREDEIDVPVAVGDVLIGDARLLHAAHENTTDERRTLITLWYQPDLASLPEPMQAQIAAKTQRVPADWPDEAKAALHPLMARYDGAARPLSHSLYQQPSEEK